jgi:thioredoxin 1
MAGKIEVLNKDNFDKFVEGNNVIIDFYADWCGPCKMMAPEFEKASESSKDVKFGKVNVEQNQELAVRFGVMSIPTTIWFKDKEQVDRFTGALTEADIKSRNEKAFS